MVGGGWPHDGIVALIRGNRGASLSFFSLCYMWSAGTLILDSPRPEL